MLLEIVKPCFFEFDEWPVEVLEHAIESELDPAETLEDIFRFKTVLTNFLEGCPYELIDHVYYTQVLNSVCSDIGSLAPSTQ